jgi:nucleoside phosphorylase
MNYHKGIVLHVLDRELQESLDNKLSEKMILDLIRIALMASKYIYVSYSHICESSPIYPQANSQLCFLQGEGAVFFLLADENINDFFAKREKRYYKDKKRYPFYFNPAQIKELFPHAECIPRKSSSTEYIRQGLFHLIHRDPRVSRLPAAKDHQVLEVISQYLPPKSSKQALTIHTFQKGFRDRKIFKRSENTAPAQHRLEVSLTRLHGQSIITETDSTIFTDIPGCQQYDALAIGTYYVFPLYRIFLSPLLGGQEILSNLEVYHNQLEEIIRFRQTPFFTYFSGMLYTIVQQVVESSVCSCDFGLPYDFWLKQLCNQIEKAVNNATDGEMADPGLITVDTAEKYLARLKICLHKTFFKGELNVNNFEPASDRKVVLILTVNDEEHKAFLNELSKQEVVYSSIVGKNNVYFQANYKRYTLVILKCMPGSIGPASSTLAVQEAISDFTPSAVIACGVAFCCKPKKENIGDVMVSKQIWQYDPQKVTEDSVIRRGDKATASPALLHRFSSAIASWEQKNPDIPVHIGLIASGEVLSNSEDFLDKLKQSEPEIIGGEMEGSGVLSAAERENCNWIIVKAICDWGAKKTDDYQPLSAQNAARYVLYVLDLFPL